MRDFDRIKPPEQRVRERADGARLDAAGADPDGRAALFTSGVARDVERGRRRDAEATPGHRAAVHCSRCDATTPLDPATAVRAALPLFLVVPWRDHPLFAICPACRHRAWLKLGA
jgi:hypothetical protein